MDANAPSKSSWPWFLKILFLVGVVVFFVSIAVPNFVHGGSTKLNAIINNLRQIDGAKEQWALDHGLTNASQLNRVVTGKDLAPYLLSRFTTDQDFGNPLYGELYLIRDLNQPCEAVLTRKLTERYTESSLPKGTVIRLYQEHGKDGYELISPNGASTVYDHGISTTIINR